jgi:MoaA/NifB/PqqE/SkfB family radical SAM enzyme
LEQLVDREDDSRNKAVFQLFFYSYLFKQTFQGNYNSIEPGLYKSREIFSKNFTWRISQKDVGEVYDFSPYAEGFEVELRKVLTEIWDENIPFDQVEEHKKCDYCPYITICGRD